MPNIIAGIFAVALGIWGLSLWWYPVMELLRGFVPLLLIVFGMVAIMAGVTRYERSEPSDSDLLATLGEGVDGEVETKAGSSEGERG
ncbi:MAG: hypothetical protein HQL48_06785 [Gammaproteobacteria bacterium]|nr:hypothetical protein [Gammaproteobacteria bacterium]